MSATSRRCDNDEPASSTGIDFANFDVSIIPKTGAVIGLGTNTNPWSGVNSTSLTLTAGGAAKYQILQATTPASSNATITIPDPGTNAAVVMLDQVMPLTDTIWGDAFTISGDVATLNTNASQRYNSWQGTTLQNAQWFGRCFLQQGTYSMRVLCIGNSNQGQMHWSVGAVPQGLTDFYTSAIAYNTVVTLSVNVLTSGYQNITGTMSSKNSSSTGYTAQITKVWFT